VRDSRGICRALDTGAASLYVYFNDTDELYAAVLDEILGMLDKAAPLAKG
jgi:AcrR family transcriptional regulator